MYGTITLSLDEYNELLEKALRNTIAVTYFEGSCKSYISDDMRVIMRLLGCKEKDDARESNGD